MGACVPAKKNCPRIFRPSRRARPAGTREGTFCDLWMPEAEADERRNWAATEAAREAVEATAAARL